MHWGEDPVKRDIFEKLCSAYVMLRVILNGSANTSEKKQECVEAFIQMCTSSVTYFNLV